MKNERLIKTVIAGVLLAAVLWLGLKPLLTGSSYRDYIKKTNGADLTFAENEYATIVIGSDPEGVASALACARTGLKTLLITEDTDLGGYLKKSMIAEMGPQDGMIRGRKLPLNQGIYQEIFGHFNLGFSGEDYEKAVRKLADAEKSLKVIYKSSVTEADLEGERLKGITVQQPDGRHYYKARNYIDATRDGQLLVLCKTPYFLGSADIGIPEFYSPLEFNFRVSGVDTEELKNSKKTTNFISDFRLVLLAYEKMNPETKILSPSFIILNDNQLVISGIKIYGVNVGDENEIKTAYLEAEDEARMLTAYLKTTLTAFKDCTYKSGPEAFFIPEYRHFEGRYRLTVSDILENRNFEDKIAMCSGAVDAGKFINKSVEYIVIKPNVYSIPLGSIVPSNLENVLMTGSKASFTSLAATSAGSIPTRITLGEAAGLISAFSFINESSPAGLLKDSKQEMKALNGYLRFGGIRLEDFTEGLLIPGTKQKLSDHWAYPYVKTLAEYGLISGGPDNDFKLGYKASQELLTVLLRNTIIKMAPSRYNLSFDRILAKYELREKLTGETAGSIVLETLSIPFEKGKALETLKQDEILPDSLTDHLQAEEDVTTDAIYGLAVETVKRLAH